MKSAEETRKKREFFLETLRLKGRTRKAQKAIKSLEALLLHEECLPFSTNKTQTVGNGDEEVWDAITTGYKTQNIRLTEPNPNIPKHVSKPSTSPADPQVQRLIEAFDLLAGPSLARIGSSSPVLKTLHSPLVSSTNGDWPRTRTPWTYGCPARSSALSDRPTSASGTLPKVVWTRSRHSNGSTRSSNESVTTITRSWTSPVRRTGRSSLSPTTVSF